MNKMMLATRFIMKSHDFDLVFGSNVFDDIEIFSEFITNLRTDSFMECLDVLPHNMLMGVFHTLASRIPSSMKESGHEAEACNEVHN